MHKTFVFISKFCSVTNPDFLHAIALSVPIQIERLEESYSVEFFVLQKTTFSL